MRYEPPKWVFIYVCAVAALVLWASSCKGLATMGGAGVGAGVGAAVGGPLGAVAGGAGGAAAGDMLVADEPTSVTNVNAQPGSTVNVGQEREASLLETLWSYRWWLLLLLLLLFERPRTLILGGFEKLLRLKPFQAIASLGASVGIAHTEDVPKGLVAFGIRRRRKGPPAAVTSSETKPHDA